MLRRITSLAASSLRYSADLILPAVCVSCGTLITHHNLLCPKCWSSLHLITPPLCDRLGIPLPGYEGSGPHISVQAVANPPVFSRARAAAHYSGIMRRLIVRFKFEDKHEPVPLFVRLMREAGRELLDDADLLVPVPLHRLRLLQRRFNQSALLAKGISRAAGVPANVVALQRTRRTETQVGLNQEARLENVAKAFGVSRERPEIGAWEEDRPHRRRDDDGLHGKCLCRRTSRCRGSPCGSACHCARGSRRGRAGRGRARLSGTWQLMAPTRAFAASPASAETKTAPGGAVFEAASKKPTSEARSPEECDSSSRGARCCIRD